MITRSAKPLPVVPTASIQRAILKLSLRRRFSSTKGKKAKNRLYTVVRRPDEFWTYLSLSTSSRTPLLTFWTASYCNTCRTVSPVLQELITGGIGEEEDGVSYCEVEYDSPDVMTSDLGSTFMITSMPTLLSFDREAQTETKVTDPKKMIDREWLKEWIRTEARRRGGGGGGGSIGSGLFRGLFGEK